MDKIALNAVKLVAENDCGNRFMIMPPFKADVILRMRSLRMWSLTQSHAKFWRITQFVLIVEPY